MHIHERLALNLAAKHISFHAYLAEHSKATEDTLTCYLYAQENIEWRQWDMLYIADIPLTIQYRAHIQAGGKCILS
jgi:hypothetical protein